MSRVIYLNPPNKDMLNACKASEKILSKLLEMVHEKLIFEGVSEQEQDEFFDDLALAIERCNNAIRNVEENGRKHDWQQQEIVTEINKLIDAGKLKIYTPTTNELLPPISSQVRDGEIVIEHVATGIENYDDRAAGDLEFTTKSEFIKGRLITFTEKDPIEGGRGYRFPWGVLAESEDEEIEEGETTKTIYFGIYWNDKLIKKCENAGMSDLAILDATMMYLPSHGMSRAVSTDDVDGLSSGTIIIDLNNEEGFSEEGLRRYVWEAILPRMDIIQEKISNFADKFKCGETDVIVKKMLEQRLDSEDEDA